MKEIDSKKQREAEFTQKHTLTPEDFRKLIFDKFERARQYHEALAKLPTFSVN